MAEKELLKKIEGIDVSKWQGDINWSKVRDEYKFVIIRLGRMSRYSFVVDAKAEANIKGALLDGRKVGLYIFVGAHFNKDAYDELLDSLRWVKKHIGVGAVRMGVWIDAEYEAFEDFHYNARLFSKYVFDFRDNLKEDLYNIPVGIYYNNDFYINVYNKFTDYNLPIACRWMTSTRARRKAGQMYQNSVEGKLYVDDFLESVKVDIDYFLLPEPKYNKFLTGHIGGHRDEESEE